MIDTHLALERTGFCYGVVPISKNCSCDSALEDRVAFMAMFDNFCLDFRLQKTRGVIEIGCLLGRIVNYYVVCVIIYLESILVYN